MLTNFTNLQEWTAEAERRGLATNLVDMGDAQYRFASKGDGTEHYGMFVVEFLDSPKLMGCSTSSNGFLADLEN